MSFLNLFRHEVTDLPPSAPSNPDKDYSTHTIFGNRIDAADRLPEPARTKLLKLRADVADAQALSRVVYENLKEKQGQVREIEGRIQFLQRGGAAPLPETLKIVEAEKASLEKFRNEAAALSAEHDRRKASRDALNAVLKPLEDYISTLPKTGLSVAPIVVPKIAKNETPVTAIDRVRGEIAALRDTLFDIENAPLPAADAKRIARRQIEALAASGTPNTLELIEGRRKFSFATKPGGKITTVLHGEGKISTGISDDQFDAESLIAWLFKDTLTARIESEIDENSDDASALTDEQRAKKTLQTKTAILACEREEEALICAAAEQGITIARRADCDPRAVLGLADTAPAPRNM